ncbi:LLM class F420-dependent oxidoreductase [Nonomuraea wenchangensis]|uniref:LLM class F420-dependent oxidoreductase n=1 Tax=Nonomuraea wenchangensis TaxID=568860 RepID=UPI003415B62A
MQVDGKLMSESLEQIRTSARQHESDGYAGLWSSESKHDPFLPLAIAGEHTSRIELGTSIAVAFARSPMTLAYTAWDLQNLTGGRFVLGLGSQVKPHIERRFSMPWSRPAARMREMVSAIRAIWSSWETGERLSFAGDFYQHTLMTPFFSPGPNPAGIPKVVVAAVGEAMSEVTGEVCDGVFLHGFTTERYIREVTLPAIERGAARAGRSLDGFQIFGLPLTATGRTEEELAGAVKKVRDQIAFYGSTPAYRGVLDLHGWGELGEELHRLSLRKDDDDRWSKMGDLITDEVLDAFAVVGEPETIAGKLVERFEGLVHRIQFYAPYEHAAGMWVPIIEELHNAAAKS